MSESCYCGVRTRNKTGVCDACLNSIVARPSLADSGCDPRVPAFAECDNCSAGIDLPGLCSRCVRELNEQLEEMAR